LNNLLVLFANNLLPIFIIAGSGVLAGKYLKVSPRPVSQIAFYIFSPCLIFYLLTTNHMDNGDILRMSGFTTAGILILGGLALLFGYLIRLERRLLVAVLLTSMFGNAGNFGLSLSLFAFGETALAHASLYFVTSAILTYTLGVIVVSLGRSSLKNALLGLFKVPAVYATILALVFNAMNWQLPLPLERPVSLLGEAAIPLLLVLLGLQFQNSSWSGQTLALTLSNVMRLVGGPVIAIGLAFLFGLQGASRQAGIAESAMPTAVLTTVLATEYDVEPAFVTTVVFLTTLLSPLTLTPLLAYLGA
jgi:predicted permease